MIYQVLLVAYLIVALLLIGFVLIQQGKGADMSNMGMSSVKKFGSAHDLTNTNVRRGGAVGSSV